MKYSDELEKLFSEIKDMSAFALIDRASEELKRLPQSCNDVMAHYNKVDTLQILRGTKEPLETGYLDLGQQTTVDDYRKHDEKLCGILLAGLHNARKQYGIRF